MKTFPQAAAPTHFRELDTRFVAGLAKRGEKGPSPYSEQIFVRREFKDGTLIDTYRVTTYNFKFEGNRWVPFVARNTLIRVPVEEQVAQEFDAAQAQDLVFLDDFEQKLDEPAALPRPKPEVVLPLPPPNLVGDPEKFNLHGYKTNYVSFENCSKVAINVSYHYETLDVVGIPGKWLPVAPIVDRPDTIRMEPGEVIVLFDKGRRIHASRLRV